MEFDDKKIPESASSSPKYNPPRLTPPLAKIALVACFSLMILFGLDMYAGSAHFGKPGPLSSSHAIWETKCDSCHSPGVTEVRATMENRCLNCHPSEKQFKFHIAGQDGSAGKDQEDKQLFCVQCHKEHRGMDFRVREVGDSQCTNCHKIHRHATDHPEFDPRKFELQKLEQIGLNFSHNSHQTIIIELGCPLCHQFDSEKNFSDIRKISFENNCKGCHPLQELTITAIIPEEDLQTLAKSIKVLEKTLGLAPHDTFLSRFNFIKSDRASSRITAIQYNPIHKDPNIWLSLQKFSREKIEAALSRGPKGVVLNCLKCHVMKKKDEQAGAKPEFGGDVSFVTVNKIEENRKATRFPHKKHALEGCDLCHENIFVSQSLVDRNVIVEKETCFRCHNNLKVKNNCVMCHQFH